MNQSPLVQSPPPATLKIKASWNLILSTPLSQQNVVERESFFNDLFCLDDWKGIVYEMLFGKTDERTGEKTPGGGEALIANVNYVFWHGVKILKSAPADDSRRVNAIQTFIPLIRWVFTQVKSDDLITVLFAENDVDAVMTDFVSSLDQTISNSEYPTELRYRTLLLALSFVSGCTLEPLTGYFLKRDLFSTLVRFIYDPPTTSYTFESSLLLGLLANHTHTNIGLKGSSMSSNPYILRIQDLVEEDVMNKIIDVTKNTLTTSTKAYVGMMNEQQLSFWGSLVGFFGLGPAPKPNTKADDAKEIVNGNPTNEKAVLQSERVSEGEGEGKEEALASGAALLPAQISTSTPAPTPVPTAPLATTTPKKYSQQRSSKNLPPPATSILLPFYKLLTLNKVFCNLVFLEYESEMKQKSTDDCLIENESVALVPTLFTLSSHVFYHASTNLRSREYANVCLMTIYWLVEEGGERFVWLSSKNVPTVPESSLSIPPTLPIKLPPTASGPIPQILDLITIYLRRNLHKNLSLSGYTLALRTLIRVMCLLKNEKGRVEYEWVGVWRAVLALGAFVQRLERGDRELDDLISHIFIVLAYAAYWGDTFFTSIDATIQLYYELLHSEEVLNELSDLLGITNESVNSTGTLSPNGSATGNSYGLEPPTANSLFFPSSPRKRPPPPNPSFSATEHVSNIRSIITFFSTKLKETPRSSGGLFSLSGLGGLFGLGSEEIEPEVVWDVIAKYVRELELIEVGEGVGRALDGTEVGEAFGRIVGEDVWGIMPAK